MNHMTDLDPCRVLIVEDEAIVQLHLRRLLTSLGYEVVGTAATAEDAVRLAAAEEPELVLMDIKLRGEEDGVSAATRIRSQAEPAIVFLTAYADDKTVERTERVGAVGYIVKPYSRNEVRAVLATAMGVHRRLHGDEPGAAAITAPAAVPPGDKESFHGMAGRSRVMQDVFTRIADVARLDWVVLIEGSTGTGKELTARALHAESGRSGGPFVAVNCAGLTDSILASQLFGHRKGTFTGATEDRPGLFESAHGGTLFLDEISDISADGQQALLRVLEDGVVQRVGESVDRQVDVRVVSATQRDLAAEVAAGRFRADLLYRLRAVRVNLPDLKERGDDIQLLADMFLARAVAHTRLGVTGFAPAARAALAAYAWPGNVRELLHAVEHGALACREGRVQVDHLPPEVLQGTPSGTGVALEPGDARTRIEAALVQAGGNRAEAARLLGISRATLYRRFAELHITPQDDDDEA